MARVEFDSDGMHFRGKAGKGVYRKVNGKTILSGKPGRRAKRKKHRTEKERANQKRFGSRVRYAMRALRNPEFRAFYEAKAREEQMPLVSIANRDALKKPTVDAIDGSCYGGQPGDVIAISASDDTGVLHVDVELMHADGRIFEEGAAEQDASGWWLYVARTSVPEGTFVHVEVLAMDRPRGKGGASAGIVVERGSPVSRRPRRRKLPGRGAGQISPEHRNDGSAANPVSWRVISSPISPAAALPTLAPTMELLNASRLLRVARVSAGISQREMARRAGISQSVVSRIEKGLISPTVETLLRIMHSAGFDVVADVVVRSTEGPY